MWQIPVQAWGLIGVALGFFLGEGTRWIRQKFHIKKLKRTVRKELNAILAQIEDKENILEQAKKALQQKRVLPLTVVRFITTGYRSYIEELYEHYSDLERNCLHVIYERLSIADSFTGTFVEDLINALKDKMVEKPWEVFIGNLDDLTKSYQVVRILIDSFLKDKPEDVFHITAKGNDR